MLINNKMAEDQLYEKITCFLSERKLENCLTAFKCHKIDDAVALYVSDVKLIELGLMYGDIVAYRQRFGDPKETGMISYEQRAEELKKKIKRTHTFINEKPMAFQESYNVTLSLKCYEKKSFVMKRNTTTVKTVCRQTSYEDLMQIAMEHYGIVRRQGVYLGNYKGEQLATKFTDLGTYAFELKEKKKGIHLYLHYPDAYSKLCLKQLLKNGHKSSDENSEEEYVLQENGSDQEIMPTWITNVHTNPSVLSADQKIVCAECGCTFEENASCLRCEQNHEYFASLQADIAKVESANPNLGEEEEQEDSLSQESLREARLMHFTRQSQRPVRYRHSIGSPSLSVVPDKWNVTSACDDIKDTAPDVVDYFGDDEVNRFMESNQNNSFVPLQVPSQGDVNLKSFIEEADKRFHEKKVLNADDVDIVKHIIVQRSPERFWPVLFRQHFNVATHDITVRFAGEPGADLGGPMREFLTLAMMRFPVIPGIILDREDNIFFKMLPESISKNHYFMLGQLVGASILQIGRGPECFNLTMLKAMYHMPVENDDVTFDNAELEFALAQIESGNTDPLLDHDIPVINDIDHNKRMFIMSFLIWKNFSAIEQFSRGLQSIDGSFMSPENFKVMLNFLAPVKYHLTLNEFMSVISFKNDAEKDSNTWIKINNLVCDVELYFAALANREIEGYSLEDILFLFTGLQRIPPFGLPKLIDIHFTEEEVLPQISTCGFTVTLPLNDVEKSLDIALKFGGGLGKV